MDLLSDLAVAPAMMARGKLKFTGHKGGGARMFRKSSRPVESEGTDERSWILSRLLAGWRRH